jgi:hypothetical protein
MGAKRLLADFPPMGKPPDGMAGEATVQFTGSPGDTLQFPDEILTGLI